MFCIRSLVLTSLLVAALGCERPFVDIATPEVTVVAPDLSIATSSAQINLIIDAVSFRNVVRVSLDGEDMNRNPTTGHWFSSVTLTGGLNEMIVEAFDVENVASLDTLYALRLGVSVGSPPQPLPTGRGGHTSTTLSNGSVVIAGGASANDVPATDEILRYSPTAGTLVHASTRLSTPRVGHTASLLPDGRILFVGGSTHASPGAVDAYVELAEIYNPVSDVVRPLKFRGSPIRRSFHSADIRVIDGATILDVYGGRGDGVPGGVRDDIRSFHLKGDSLIALGPAIGGRLVGPTWGHTQTALNVTGSTPTQYLIVSDEFVFTIDFSDPRGLVPRPAPLPSVVRSQHASFRLGSDFVGISGGRIEDGSPTRSIDIYSDRARRFFTVPMSTFPLSNRFAHRVSRLADGRLLVTGGFDAAGNGIAASEIVVISFQN